MFNYFPFTQTGTYSGIYSTIQNTNIIPSGNLFLPSDILKLNAGTNCWSQITEQVSFLSNTVNISSLTQADWTTLLKEKWLDSYLEHVGLITKISPSQYSIIMNLCESVNLFENLSAPSIAYVNKNDGINQPNIDNFLTNEISIGLNSYKYNFIKEYAFTLPNTNILRNVILTYHTSDDVYISNCAYITYNGFSDVAWAFNTYYYNQYDISANMCSLTNGGGNNFTEIKLAGNHIQAHYMVKKNIDENDPTIGMNPLSGFSGTLCIGDNIVIIDRTVFTENSTSGWTWVGDLSVLVKNNVWNLCDVSGDNVALGERYQNVPIIDDIMPLRVIQFLFFNQFG